MNKLMKTLSLATLLVLGGLTLTACGESSNAGSDAGHGHSHD